MAEEEDAAPAAGLWLTLATYRARRELIHITKHLRMSSRASAVWGQEPLLFQSSWWLLPSQLLVLQEGSPGPGVAALHPLQWALSAVGGQRAPVTRPPPLGTAQEKRAGLRNEFPALSPQEATLPSNPSQGNEERPTLHKHIAMPFSKMHAGERLQQGESTKTSLCVSI